MKLKLDLHYIYNHGSDIVHINRKLSGQTLFGHRRESRTLIAGEGRSFERNHFHHLANVRREAGFNAVNLLRGFRQVRIVSPHEVIHENDEEEI